MKVLQLISSGGMYGAEAVVLNLARALEGQSHHSVVGVFAHEATGDVQLHREAVALGLESHLLPCRSQFDRAMMADLRRFVVQHGIDVVHAHGYKADVYAYLALRKAGIPLISTCHLWVDSNLKVRMYGALDRWVLKRFAGVAAVSDALYAQVVEAGVAAAKVRMIPNGIDARRFTDAARRAELTEKQGRPKRIGLVGRLAAEKGIDIFLRASAQILRGAHADVQCVVAGEGPDRGALERLAVELAIERQVTFLGRCDTMPELLASLDLVVSASRSEGLPIAILESMASGRPIVATDVGAVSLALDGGRAGLLVPAEDVDALSGAMLRLLEDAELGRELGERARQRVLSVFSAEHMADEYLALYQRARSSEIGIPALR